MARVVGVPVQELEFIQSFLPHMHRVITPGAGRRLFVLQEVDVSMGRPDLIALSCSPSALEAFGRKRLRLPSYAAARVLDPTVPVGQTGVSKPYERRLRATLEESGWTSRVVPKAARVISYSVGIEAKIREIPRAVRQVARFRALFDRAAVLAPQSPAKMITMPLLDSYGIGLIQPNQESWSWTAESKQRPVSIASRLWLLELLQRELEADRVYIPSRSRKISIAVR
jgi:hypothetical protein